VEGAGGRLKENEVGSRGQAKLAARLF